LWTTEDKRRRHIHNDIEESFYRVQAAVSQQMMPLAVDTWWGVWKIIVEEEMRWE
jgi:hypothetical protein